MLAMPRPASDADHTLSPLCRRALTHPPFPYSGARPSMRHQQPFDHPPLLRSNHVHARHCPPALAFAMHPAAQSSQMSASAARKEAGLPNSPSWKTDESLTKGHRSELLIDTGCHCRFLRRTPPLIHASSPGYD